MWPILDWLVYGNQILIYLNISVFDLYSQCSRSKFNFLFQLSSYTAEEAFFNISFAINMASQHSYCKFHFFVAFLFFFCGSKMPKTPKILTKKHGSWWIIHGKLKVIFFFFQNVEMSYICNKSFGKIVNGVQRGYNVRDHNNEHIP